MILKVQKLREGVIERLETSYDARERDLEFVDLHYVTKINLEGLAERIKQTVTFRGTLTSRIEQVCSRCLERIETEMTAPFDLSYEILGLETVDTTGELRDILILQHPERFLCASDCHGICTRCGTNLNRDACHCKQAQKDAATSQSETTVWDSLKEKFKYKER
ncbi:MAG: DUF177 domain-containing protein [Candidatus Omnitrophica bacterium]|nr:DUF177 domain-containing protein [Candidatus Omnitrophota bacterium]